METLTGRLRGQDGTALIIAVIAMLVLGVIGFSFAILANLEVRIGMNQKHEVQALALAEAGLEHGRQLAKVAGQTFNTLWGAGTNGAVLITDQQDAALGDGKYSVRIDNDCDPLVPVAMADPGCATFTDQNEKAILTAWAESANGRGRARVRVWLTADNPWNHVCSSGDGTLCTDPPNNQNATINPESVEDPNGPRTFSGIPVPNQIRCTAVAGGALGLTGSNYPVPNGVTVPGNPRGPCVMYPYYLTALTTPCAVCNPATLGYNPPSLVPGVGEDPSRPICNTGVGCLGMVRTEADVSIQKTGGSGAIMRVPAGTLGAPGAPATVYVFGKVTVKNGITINGTLVLHGGGDAGGGPARDLSFQGTNTVTTQPPKCPTCAYPLAILGYNPNEPAPPGQTIWLNISNNTTTVNGLVYTGGTADFNPITVNGGVVGYTVNVNNAATEFTYQPTYGDAAPSPGFDTPAGGATASVIRRTWAHCTTYADESGGPTACN